jgi:hypothetical protein
MSLPWLEDELSQPVVRHDRDPEEVFPMTTSRHMFVGTRISGARPAVLMVARAWKPWTFQQYIDNSTAVSARRHRHT